MILAARQLGWLAATPEDRNHSKPVRWPHNRARQLEIEGRDYGMPEIEAGQYLLDALMHAGPSIIDPMGNERPLSWVEIAAYQMATRRITEPWEAETLADLSRAYLEGKAQGTDPLGMSPVRAINEDEDA